MIRSLVFSIDPGVNCGAAVWKPELLIKGTNRPSPPIAAFAILSGQDGTWESRIESMVRRFKAAVGPYSGASASAFIEWPSFFESEAGQKSAKQGDLVKLTYAAGRVAQVCVGWGLKVELVPVNEWKGQLDKERVKQRIERKLGAEACAEFRTHAWDAVGIGLWARGQF